MSDAENLDTRYAVDHRLLRPGARLDGVDLRTGARARLHVYSGDDATAHVLPVLDRVFHSGLVINVVEAPSGRPWRAARDGRSARLARLRTALLAVCALAALLVVVSSRRSHPTEDALASGTDRVVAPAGPPVAVVAQPSSQPVQSAAGRRRAGVVHVTEQAGTEDRARARSSPKRPRRPRRPSRRPDVRRPQIGSMSLVSPPPAASVSDPPSGVAEAVIAPAAAVEGAAIMPALP